MTLCFITSAFILGKIKMLFLHVQLYLYLLPDGPKTDPRRLSVV